MSEIETTDAETPAESQPSILDETAEAARKAALAAAGAVAVATEKADEVFGVLVQRGEKAKEDATVELKRIRDETAPRREEAANKVRAGAKSILSRLNLATHGEVKELHARVDELSQKVEGSDTQDDSV